MKKVFSALLVAPFAFAAIAQTPVAPNVTIADSTGNRPAVAAIVMPVIPTPQQVSQIAKDEVLAASTKPWTSYFIGQTKSIVMQVPGFFGTYMLQQATARIGPEGRLQYSYGGSGWTNFGGTLGDLPSGNQTLRNSFLYYANCGGDQGSTTYEIIQVMQPTGVTINNSVPTGWSLETTQRQVGQYCG